MTAPASRPPVLTLVAILALLAGNAYQYAVGAGHKLDLGLEKKKSAFYEARYKEQLQKDARLTQDFAAMYASTVKQAKEAARKGDRKATLESLDSANFLAGFVSRATRDGSPISSFTFGSGTLSPADEKKLDAATQTMHERAEVAVQRLLQMAEAKPEDAAQNQAQGNPQGMPQGQGMPAMPAGKK